MKRIILIFVLVIFLSGCCCIFSPTKKASESIDQNPNIENKQSAKILTKYIEENQINATILEDKENKVVIKYDNKNYTDKEGITNELTKLGIGLLITYPNAQEYMLVHDVELNSSTKKIEVSIKRELLESIIDKKNITNVQDYIKIKIDDVGIDVLNLTDKDAIIRAIEK